MSETLEIRRAGYRGYIGSRPIAGSRVAQHIQNLVIREHARKHGLGYLLSATEYAMPGCYLILTQLLEELSDLEGIIAYSLFMLPRARERRIAMMNTLLDRGGVFHAAVEDIRVATAGDVRRIDDIITIQQLLDKRSA